jgi:hypothetical protein
MTEQRRFTRTAFAADAVVRCGKTVVSGSIHDISLKGLYIQVDGQLPVQKQVYVTLQLQDANLLRVKLKGRIVRQDAGGAGVEFDPMNFDTFMQLKQIVSLMTGDENQVISEFVDFVGKE